MNLIDSYRTIQQQNMQTLQLHMNVSKADYILGYTASLSILLKILVIGNIFYDGNRNELGTKKPEGL